MCCEAELLHLLDRVHFCEMNLKVSVHPPQQLSQLARTVLWDMGARLDLQHLLYLEEVSGTAPEAIRGACPCHQAPSLSNLHRYHTGPHTQVLFTLPTLRISPLLAVHSVAQLAVRIASRSSMLPLGKRSGDDGLGILVVRIPITLVLPQVGWPTSKHPTLLGHRLRRVPLQRRANGVVYQGSKPLTKDHQHLQVKAQHQRI